MSEIYVVGFDGTQHGRRAVDYAAARAKRSKGSVHLVFVLEWSPFSFYTPEELNERHKRREQEIERATSVVEPVVEELKADGVQADFQVRHGHAAELLCEIATEKGATQIVVGKTSESPLAQRLLGSLVLSLAQVSPVPLTIVP